MFKSDLYTTILTRNDCWHKQKLTYMPNSVQIVIVMVRHESDSRSLLYLLREFFLTILRMAAPVFRDVFQVSNKQPRDLLAWFWLVNAWQLINGGGIWWFRNFDMRTDLMIKSMFNTKWSHGAHLSQKICVFYNIESDNSLPFAKCMCTVPFSLCFSIWQLSMIRDISDKKASCNFLS